MAVPGTMRYSTSSLGKVKRADQNAGQNHHVRHVVEHQRKKRVQIPNPEPAVAAVLRTPHAASLFPASCPEAYRLILPASNRKLNQA